MIYVLSILFATAGVLMLLGAWLAAAAVFFGCVLVAIPAVKAEMDGEDRTARSEDPDYFRIR